MLRWLHRRTERCLQIDQIHRVPHLAEHLEQQRGRLLDQVNPMTQRGGMDLGLAANLQPITQ